MSSNRSRRIAALRALAERPGTPQEGLVAKKKLEEALAKEPASSNPFPDLDPDTVRAYQEFLHKFNEYFKSSPASDFPFYRDPFVHHEPSPEDGYKEYVESTAGGKTEYWEESWERFHTTHPDHVTKRLCPCGAYLNSHGTCTLPETHANKRWKVKREFPEGSMVHYCSRSTRSGILGAKIIKYSDYWNLVEIQPIGGGNQIVPIYENGICCLSAKNWNPRRPK